MAKKNYGNIFSTLVKLDLHICVTLAFEFYDSLYVSVFIW